MRCSFFSFLTFRGILSDSSGKEYFTYVAFRLEASLGMTDSVKTLQDRVKQLRALFDAKRKEVNASLDESSNHISTIEKLCAEATRMHSDLENKLANASNEEKEWKDIQRKLATTAFNGMVILNVGGKKYSTIVETLTRERNTFFTALFSEQCQLERDPVDKSIFIDRDGKLFQHILAYFRTRKIPVDVMSNESLRQTLIMEAEYFRLHDLIFILTEPDRKLEEQRRINAYFPNGSLIDKDQQVKLNEFYGKKEQQWSLIYKASRDGFDAAAFHRLCDNHGPTMTIIKSKNNYLFGGYTAAPWTSDGSYKEDRTAFLFTLTNPHDIPPTKYCLNDARITSTVYRNADYGPTFGGGFDLVVAGGSNANNLSYTNFPHSYIDTTGKGYKTFTGAKNFTTSDIEIYRLS